MSKVYLLEDDKSICELVSCALESSGIRVNTFNTVRDFSAAMQEERPDLCLLDIMLPDGNGLDVLTAKTVTDFLLELRAQGKTVLLSTHIFGLVEKVCDRVGVVIDGRMAACGTLAEVAGGRSLEDAFFDLYAASAGEAS